MPEAVKNGRVIVPAWSDTHGGHRGAAKIRIQQALSMGLIEELPKRYNNVKYYRFVEKKMQG